MSDLTRGRAATCVTCEQMLDGSRCTNPMCPGFVDESEVDRLEQERDSLKAQVQEWMEGSAQLQVKLDEVERLLENDVLPRLSEGGDPFELGRNRIRTFLAGLSTVTPEDWAGHLRERAEGGGKTAAELREQYRLTPRCERVAVCCGAPYEGGFARSCAQCHEGSRSYKCATHGGPVPAGGDRCTPAMTPNVTT